MLHNKGFTLIELLIVVAIILILVAIFFGAVGPRKAGAQTFSSDSRMVLYLAEKEIPFLWASKSGHLTIFRKPADGPQFAVELCKFLKPMDERLTRVTISDGSDAEPVNEIYNTDGFPSPRASRAEATCQ